jgi:hypothetical protein
MQEYLTDTLKFLSAKFGYEYLPIGDAWKKLLEDNFDLQLWTGDGIHPTYIGSYVTACVIYSYIFKDDLSNSKYQQNQMNDEMLIKKIHQVANELVN